MADPPPFRASPRIPPRLSRGARGSPRPRGLSFLEAQIALVLLMVGVIALIQVPSLILEGTRLSEQHVTAARCAQYLLELELAKTHDALARQPTTSGWTAVTPPICPGAPSGLYDYQVLTTDHPRMGRLVRVVTIEVRWMDPEAKRYGRYEFFSLSGYKTRPTSSM